jgi:iron-sulfur cluster assembly protein
MRRFLEAPALPALGSAGGFSPLVGGVTGAVLLFEAAEVVFVAAAVVALSGLVGSGFLAGAVLVAVFVATLTGALAGAFAGALGAVFAGALAGALAAGFTGALVAGFVVGFAAGLETFLTGALAAGFAAGFFAGALAAGFFAGALAAGLETFFAGDFEAAGLGLAAAALFFDADAFGFEALAFGLAAGFLAADFLDDGLNEGMGDGRWKRGMWIYHSHSMGAAEFPLARRTKRERFGCVKGFLKNKFLVLRAESLSLAQEFIFGFEFPCGWLTLPGEMITLTETAAAELKRLLAAKGETEGAGLCLAVRKGGCAGWQYEMRVGQPSEGDVLVEDHGARVIVAADSVERLRGCEVDFSDDLTDSGFKVHNPRAARSCGCGTSFESLEEPAAGPDETGTEDCRA